MRRFCYIAVLAIAVSQMAAIILSTPTNATTLSQARKLCKKNPNCAETNPGLFCVNTEDAICGHVVYCPKKGKCWVSSIQADGGKHFGSGAIISTLAGGTKITTRPRRVPSGGLLETGPGFAPQGPGSTGTPVAPAAPPPVILK
jgi:hypothetical protein